MNSFLISYKKNINDENLNDNLKKNIKVFRCFIMYLFSNKCKNLDYFGLLKEYYEKYLNISNKKN
jgi:hypothetical protein